MTTLLSRSYLIKDLEQDIMKHIMLLFVSTRSNFLAFESSILITIMKDFFYILMGAKERLSLGKLVNIKASAIHKVFSSVLFI